jgi:hypothetical protein
MKKTTKKVNEISINDRSTWSSGVFLTFDTDWANDFIIEDTVEILNRYNLSATLFATGQSSLIRDLQSSENFEVGIHPNFNPLLFEKEQNTSANEIIYALKEKFPDAKSLRSHSLTQNERLLDLFSNHEIKNICNHFLPFTENSEIQPFMLWNDLQLIPHRFQDNVSLKISSLKPLDLLNSNGLLVYNFHPIHVYLNTVSLNHYEKAKPFYHDRDGLEQHRYNGAGIRTDFIKLCEKLS